MRIKRGRFAHESHEKRRREGPGGEEATLRSSLWSFTLIAGLGAAGGLANGYTAGEGPDPGSTRRKGSAQAAPNSPAGGTDAGNGPFCPGPGCGLAVPPSTDGFAGGRPRPP